MECANWIFTFSMLILSQRVIVVGVPLDHTVITEITESLKTSDGPSTTKDGVSQPNSMPDGWKMFCTSSVKFVDWNFTTLPQFEISHMIQISCHLGNGNRLYFSDFRTWQTSTGNSAKVAIKVACDVETGGSFHVPWPMKVENLVYFSVSGCRLPDYYSEYFDKNMTLIPDQLRVLEIRNCTAEVTLSQFLEISTNISQSTHDVECGPLTLEKFVFSGFDFELDFGDYFNDYDGSDVEPPTSDISVVDVDKISDTLYRESISPRILCKFDQLRHIDESSYISMSGKHLFSTHRKSTFPELLSYNLSNLELFFIPKDLQNWRINMPKLKLLDLSHNYISEVELYDSSFGENDMGNINLKYNNISRITRTCIDTLMRMKRVTIDLRHNPLDCSCDQLAELYEFLQRPDLGKYEYLRDLECHSPSHYTGRKVGELTKAEIECQEIAHALIGVLSAVIVVLIVMVVVLVRYRKEVVILVYTRLHIVLPCQPVENSEYKEFDAFISYSSMDDEWVMKTLVEKLENPTDGSSLRLCLHHRDFEIGAAIADNVVQSVESSRHTVMVLSRNFVQSEWCIYEFRTAMHQSLIEKKKHLIVIILEDVPKSELDADLRKCLETFTYIQAGEKLFWDKIVYSLTRGIKKKSKPSLSATKDSHKEIAKRCGDTTV